MREADKFLWPHLVLTSSDPAPGARWKQALLRFISRAQYCIVTYGGGGVGGWFVMLAANLLTPTRARWVG